MFVGCDLRVLSGGGTSESGDHELGELGSPQLTFASLGYLDSHRSVIECMEGGGSSLGVGLEIVSLLVTRYRAEVSDVDIGGCNDVRYTLRIPMPETIATGPSRGWVSDLRLPEGRDGGR
jgi:hypothetical protein